MATKKTPKQRLQEKISKIITKLEKLGDSLADARMELNTIEREVGGL